jgi:HD superfamily phosphohydrolase
MQPSGNVLDLNVIKTVEATLYGDVGFAKKIDSCLEAIGLTRSVPSLSSESKPFHDKNIKDSVWGMMPFSRDEMALINSPVVQRLRTIKQLGFTYLTYPSAEHSRFAHTLGVTHVVKLLVRSISDAVALTSEIKIADIRVPLFNLNASSNEFLRRCLVHAAILHDIGHFAFSHAGEQAVSNSSKDITIGGMTARSFRRIFAAAGLEAGLSECLSIAIVLSPKFREFYASVTGETDVSRSIHVICCFIAGIPHSVDHPGLANIISGAVVDADKIDYLNRDARECGIPVGVDVSRIFLHSTLLDISAEAANRLNSDRHSRARDNRIERGVHFIVNSSGIDTYDELTKTRSVLYNRVYFHHLTLNIEQIFSMALQTASHHQKMDVFDFFPFGDVETLAFLSNGPAARFARRIKNRIPMRRALFLSRQFCQSFTDLSAIFTLDASNDEKGPSLDHLIKSTEVLQQSAWRVWDRIVPYDRRPIASPVPEIVENIRKLALEIRPLLDSSFDSTTASVDDILVGFAPRLKPRDSKEVLVLEKRAIARSNEWSTAEELSQAEWVSRSLDYIFADQEWLRSVRVATLMALQQFARKQKDGEIDDNRGLDGEQSKYTVKSGLHLAMDEIASRIGFDYEEFIRDAEIACRKGVLTDYRLVPVSFSMLKNIQTTAERFKYFTGEKGWTVTAQSLEAFVRQFPPDLRADVLDLVKSFKVLHRNDASKPLAGVIEALELQGQQNVAICRFSPNSGNLIGMLFEQDERSALEEHGHKFCRDFNDLDSALADHPDRPIVFVDDQFGTGGQAEAQLRQWLGEPRSTWPENIRDEQNIYNTSLTDRTRSALTANKVTLAFLFGTDEGKKRIERVAKDIGFSHLSVVSNKLLTGETANLPASLRVFLSLVGESLLTGIRKAAEPPAVAATKNDALGYSGTASIILTQFNVPSNVITAFWCTGMFGEVPWVPLFIRRGYLKHLVLS